jgi:hypothetical protein
LRCGVAAALLAALAGACLPLDMSRDRRAAVRLRGKKLMVAPFRMPNAAYFESKIGANLAQMVEGIIRTELPDAKLIALDSVPIELTELADVDKARLSPLRVAKDMGANYVLYGEIHLLRAKDPKAVGILQGTLILSARVVDLDENQVVWRLQPTVKKYYYPPLFAGTEMIPAQETDEEEVIRKVMLTAALELSSVFTGKKPTLEPKSRL